MADVFISYSRRDQELVRDLVDRLTARGKDCWIDWEDIPPSAEWLREIYEGIEGCDAFVFVITPDSARSLVCRDEIDHAEKLNKRIVPLLGRDIDGTELPEAIASRNWIVLPQPIDPDEAVDRLVDAIERDLDNVRRHTNVLEHALAWTSKDRDGSLLLRGSELRDAEDWLARAASLEPAPIPLQYEFVHASRAAATRRQRLVVTAFAIGAAIALALAALAALQRNHAISERKTAESRLVAGEARTQLDNRLDLGALLALAAYRIKPTPQARDSVLVAMRRTDRLAGTFDAGGRVNVVRVAPKGSLIAVARKDGSILIWNNVRRTTVARLTARGGVRGLAFSSDSALLAAVGIGGTLDVWRIARNGSARPVDVPHFLARSAAFAPRGHDLVLGTNDGIAVWSPGRSAPRPVDGASGLHEVNRLAVAGDGTIAAGGRYGATVFEPAGGRFRKLMVGGDQVVQDLAFAPGERRLAVVEGSRVLVWAPGRPLQRFDVPGATSAAFGPTGALATGAADGTVSVWPANGTGRPRSYRLGGAAVDSVAFDTANDVIVAASERRLALWADSGSELQRTRSLPLETLDDLVVVGPRSFVAAGDGKVLRADVSGRAPKPLTGTPSGSIRLAASRDGSLVAAGGVGSQAVVVWKRDVPRPPLSFAVDVPVSIALSSDGTSVAQGTQRGTVDAWNLGSPRRPVVKKLAKDAITALAASPSGAELAAGAIDGSIALGGFDLGNVRTIGAFGRAGVNALAYAPDGKRLAVGGRDGTVTVVTLPAKTAFTAGVGNEVTSVAFDPTANTLAAGDAAGHVFLWDARRGVALGPPLEVGDRVAAVAFSPTALVVGLHGGTVSVFRAEAWDARAAIASLCRRLGRTLTDDERRAYLPAGGPRDVC